MSDVAQLIADMVRAGVDPDLIGRTAAVLADRETIVANDMAVTHLRSKAAERQARYDVRKRQKASELTSETSESVRTDVRVSELTSENVRKRQKASESVRTDDIPFPKTKGPPDPLKNSTPIPPPSPPKGGSSPKTFDQFWLAYPRKVGKRAAETAYDRARKRAGPDPHRTILIGLERAKASERWRKEPEFIPHPQTWLNQDRWLDELEDATAGPISSVLDPSPEAEEIRRKQREWTRKYAETQAAKEAHHG